MLAELFCYYQTEIADFLHLDREIIITLQYVLHLNSSILPFFPHVDLFTTSLLVLILLFLSLAADE